MCPPVHSGRQVLKHLQIAGLAREITANDLLHKRREFYDVAEFLLECDDQVPADHDRQDRPTVGNTGGGNPRTVGSEGYRPMLNAAIARRSAERRTTKSAGAPSPAPAPVLSPAVQADWKQPDGDAKDQHYDCNSGRQVRYLQLELNRMKKENKQLRQEKISVETLYQQLVTEQRHERYDERRLNVLKSQVGP